jgi:isoquinoline 1-oxidoreductase subunit beta
MSRVGKIARRTFLGLGLAAAGGLAVGYYMYRRPYPDPLDGTLAEGEHAFTPYVIVGAEGVTVIAPRAEMGQGIHTTLAALVAEELDVALADIKVEHGPPGYAYWNGAMLTMGGPFPWFDEGFVASATRGAMGVVGKFVGLQVTGGSSSTIDGFAKMRIAGATAREALKAAAARRWAVDIATLRTEGGRVIRADGTALGYPELAAEAATADLPDAPALREPSAWRILGKSQQRVDLREKVTGAPIFGIDIRLPEMLHATVVMSPRLGAKAASHDPAPALAVRGVRKVVPIATDWSHGFGIVADSTWAAFRGAEALKVEWQAAPYPADDAGIEAAWRAALDAPESFAMGGEGDPDAVFAAAPAERILEAEYEVPFLAHATMEPMNATAEFRDDRLTVWTGTQAPGVDAILCARALGIATEDVTVHVTRLGGGFGRRAMDPAIYAALIARETDGRPVKVTWSREEDMRHDFYRPRAIARMRAVVTPGEGPAAFEARVAAPSVMASLLTRTFTEVPVPPEDDSILDGQFNQPLGLPNARFAAHKVDTAIPTGFWRSVGNSVNGFFLNAFLDEVAGKAGRDPLEMRLALMQADAHRPARLVMERLREISGWGAPMPQGHGKGVAFTLSFGTWVGQVVEVDATGPLRITRVWCVADPGTVLDPGIFTDQITSGIVYGLSAALGQKITFADGAVEQGNFDSFDAMRLAQCPQMTVEILQNAPRMGGAGEPGTPPAIPALAGAIFAATGRRLRRMPFSDDIRFA